MSGSTNIFEIRQADKCTVLTFLKSNTWDFKFLSKCEDELDGLLHEQPVKKLAFDLQNIGLVSSTLLNIFVGLQRSGIEIELWNANAEVRDVLETTRLDSVIRLKPDPE